MLDVKVVGSELTPAQQDEVLGDLGFFLDNFGSTYAVRIKLQAQKSDIQRLERQIKQLLALEGENSREEEEEEEEEEDGGFCPPDDEQTGDDVDRTMTDLDFFLRTFGSTRAVRDKLLSQRLEVVGLQRTLQWLEERQRTMVESNGPSEVGYLCTKRGEPSTERATSSQESRGINHDDQSNIQELQVEEAPALRSPGTEHAPSEKNIRVFVTTEIRSPDTRHQGSATGATYCGLEHEQVLAERSVEGGDEEKRVAQTSETVVVEMTSSKCEEEGHSEEQNGAMDSTVDFSSTGAEGYDVLVTNALQCASELRAEVKIVPATKGKADDEVQEELKSPKSTTEDSAVTVEPIEGAARRSAAAGRAAPSSSLKRKTRRRCRHPACQKGPQANGLCCRHGGYRMCKADGCDRRAVSRFRCFRHGGGTKCKVDNCTMKAKRKGYCCCHLRQADEVEQE